MADLTQYLELLGRGAQAAQWGLLVSVIDLLLLVIVLWILTGRRSD